MFDVEATLRGTAERYTPPSFCRNRIHSGGTGRHSTVSKPDSMNTRPHQRRHRCRIAVPRHRLGPTEATDWCNHRARITNKRLRRNGIGQTPDHFRRRACKRSVTISTSRSLRSRRSTIGAPSKTVLCNSRSFQTHSHTGTASSRSLSSHCMSHTSESVWACYLLRVCQQKQRTHFAAAWFRRRPRRHRKECPPKCQSVSTVLDLFHGL